MKNLYKYKIGKQYAQYILIPIPNQPCYLGCFPCSVLTPVLQNISWLDKIEDIVAHESEPPKIFGSAIYAGFVTIIFGEPRQCEPVIESTKLHGQATRESIIRMTGGPDVKCQYITTVLIYPYKASLREAQAN